MPASTTPISKVIHLPSKPFDSDTLKSRPTLPTRPMKIPLEGVAESRSGTLGDIVACVLPAVAVALVATPGTVAVVTALEGADAIPLPALLVVTTVKV